MTEGKIVNVESPHRSILDHFNNFFITYTSYPNLGKIFKTKDPASTAVTGRGEKDCKSTCPKETYKASISRKFFFIHQKEGGLLYGIQLQFP